MDIVVTDLENDIQMTLREYQRSGGERPMVIDFWHTKCTRCPAALSKLNKEAEKKKDEIMFVSCALSQGEGNKEMVADLAADWDNLHHIFMEFEQKELAKKAFGFAAVPFYVVVGGNGDILGCGEPKSIDYNALIMQSMQAPVEESDIENHTPANHQKEDVAIDASSAVKAAPVAQPSAHVFVLDEDF